MGTSEGLLCIEDNLSRIGAELSRVERLTPWQAAILVCAIACAEARARARYDAEMERRVEQYHRGRGTRPVIVSIVSAGMRRANMDEDGVIA